KRVGLDEEHCMMVMRKIAQFHAASLVLKEKNPELLETFIDPPSNYMLLDLFDKSYDSHLIDMSESAADD
ncbi:hypothetical protein L9F63_023772, partial [Diploptera punctata]